VRAAKGRAMTEGRDAKGRMTTERNPVKGKGAEWCQRSGDGRGEGKDKDMGKWGLRSKSPKL
jgi:hypothetical protein